MKVLEQGQIALRARVRRRLAAMLASPRPARLLLRLDDLDAPGQVPAMDRNLEAWQEQLVEFYRWAGVVPTVLVGRPNAMLLLGLLRFCHRVEAPSILRTCGAGLSLRLAEELVDAGLDEIWLRMGATADPLQERVCGESVAVTRAAVQTLLQARKDRKAPLKVGIEVPFRLESARELPGVFREARELGVDRARVVPPWRGPSWDDRQSVMLDLMALERPPFNLTSPSVSLGIRRMVDGGEGASRLRGHCPVGTGQLEILPDRSMRSCPFKEGRVDAGPVVESWKKLESHRARVRACDRSCYHPDLLP